MSLIKSSLIYTLGRIIPQAIGFILLPLYTSYLSANEYGIVESLFTLTMLLTIFFSMATERSMFRVYYDYDTDEGKKIFVGNSFLLILAFSCLFTSLILLFPKSVSYIFESIPFTPYYNYAILTAFVMAFSFVPQTLFQVKNKPTKFLALTTITFLLNIGFILYFLILKNQGALGLIKGRFYGNLLMFPAYLIITIQASSFKLNKKVIKNILSFSLPMVPTLLAAWILNMSNRIFIEKYFSLEEVGVFSLAFKISSLVTLVVGAIFTAFNPVFYKLANNSANSESKSKVKALINLIFLLIIYVSVISIFLSKEMFLIFFPKEYQGAASIFSVLIISILFIQISGLYNLMIYQKKKSLWIMYVSILGAIASIAFNFLLVPKYSMTGAALASVITAFLMLLAKHYYAKKSFYIKLPYRKVLVSLLVFALVIVVSLYININIYLLLTLKVVIIFVVTWFLYFKYKKELKLLASNDE